MFRVIRFSKKIQYIPINVQVHHYLTNEYRCQESWNSHRSSPILTKVDLHDLYPLLDQNYTQKGIISAIDVDLFANAVKEEQYLDELRDLLIKLRQTAETGSTLESTHHATIRNYIEFNRIDDLLDMLKDPLNYGLFLDDYSANILLDNLLKSELYEKAALVASIYMQQEEYSNRITCALCLFACFKHILNYTPPELVVKDDAKVKIEEVKIRIKFLRNPYFDDHFDIKDSLLLSGKTLAWISEQFNDNVSYNLQIIGWLYYKKEDKLTKLCETLSKSDTFKIYKEVLDLIKKESSLAEGETRNCIEKCLSILNNKISVDNCLEDDLKISIENAINRCQKDDVQKQHQLFQSWSEIREQKLAEQTERLDKAKRIEYLQDKQKEMAENEQKLWFFENEEDVDLKLEEKEQKTGKPNIVKNISKQADNDYIPPEILPRRK